MLFSDLNSIHNFLNLLGLLINLFFFFNHSTNLLILSSLLEELFFLAGTFSPGLLKLLLHLLLVMPTSICSTGPTPTSSLSSFKSDSPSVSLLTYNFKPSHFTVIHISTTVSSYSPTDSLIHFNAVVAELLLLINSHIVLITTIAIISCLGLGLLFSSSNNTTALLIPIRLISSGYLFTPTLTLLLLSELINIFLPCTDTSNDRLDHPIISILIYIYYSTLSIIIFTISHCRCNLYNLSSFSSLLSMVSCEVLILLLLFWSLLSLNSLSYLLLISGN